MSRRIDREARPLDHQLVALEHRCVRARARYQLLQALGKRDECEVVGLTDWGAGRACQQGVQLSLACATRLLGSLLLQLDHAELGLRLDHVLLRRLSHRIPQLADFQQRGEQLSVALQYRADRVCGSQRVVGLLDARSDAQAGSLDLL